MDIFLYEHFLRNGPRSDLFLLRLLFSSPLASSYPLVPFSCSLAHGGDLGTSHTVTFFRYTSFIMEKKKQRAYYLYNARFLQLFYATSSSICSLSVRTTTTISCSFKDGVCLIVLAFFFIYILVCLPSLIVQSPRR